MTGTAATEVSEFDGIYKLPVAVVPTNRTISRVDNPDVVFRCGCLGVWVWVRVCVCGGGRAAVQAVYRRLEPQYECVGMAGSQQYKWEAAASTMCVFEYVWDLVANDVLCLYH
jgi:hypothetical protein